MKGATIAVLPVRSTQPVPKEKLLACSKESDNIVVDAPVKLGQEIIENSLGLGVDIVSTREVKAAE